MSARMSPLKKTASIAGLILAAVVCVVLYASLHLTFKARTLDIDPEARLGALRAAERLFPWNEECFEQAGVTLLGRISENLSDSRLTRTDLKEAHADLRRALKLNPGSAAAHLYYAKTLDLMKFLGTGGGESPFPEYEKAARLAGPDRSLIREIGTILLGRWEILSESEKEFTQGLLKKGLLAGDMMGFQEVLHIWDLNIRDDAVMQKIIPDSPPLLRTYAQFLADKGLSLEARHKTLARAERLEYEQAWEEAEMAQNLMKTGAIPEALQHLSGCLNILKKIKFFGRLTDEQGIGAEMEKKATLLRTVSLDLAKAKLEENRNLAEAQEPLRAYLALESDFNQITALETYLKELNIIPETDADLQIKNIRQLSFDILLMFKLHKYRQIISLGSQLQRSLLVADPSANKDLSEIFRIVGDSYLKLDFVYESEAFYQRALELSPGDPEVLLRMRKYYERRNETEKLSEVDRLLSGVLSEGVILSQPRLLPKGVPFEQTLLMNVSETRVRFDLQFEALPENPRPLVSVYLNDRVYWEQYLPGASISLELSTEEGFNRLQVLPVNGPVVLAKVSITRL